MLTRHIVKGVLTYHLGVDEVNVVNATQLLKQRDINLITEKFSNSYTFTNLITLTIKTNKEERWISGTLLDSYRERVVRIGPYPVDLLPVGHVLLISHMDKPGIILDKKITKEILSALLAIPDIKRVKEIDLM
jgi:D-3-phosphoglycerate dehydrogenase